jgi:hypothetical protein
MTDLYDPREYMWMTEYLWPKLRPAFVEIAREVTEVLPGVSVDVSGSPPGSITFSGSASFWFAPIDDYVVLGVICSPDLATLRTFPRIECHSEFFELFRDGDRIRRRELGDKGPQASFRLERRDLLRQDLEQWADATVAYVHSNSGTIITALQKQQNDNLE